MSLAGSQTSKGFTLFETLVVMAILALLTGLAIPYLVGSGVSSNLRRASAELAENLRQTRSQAIVENASRVLTLDVDGRNYKTIDGRVENLPMDADVMFLTAESEVVAGAIAAVRFFPDGSSTGGHIELKRGDETYRVNVNWLTGLVSVER
ncbi:MAG: prepilin-type N-terminal cleavage/methylation domain-containing protein [bacterium]|nr:prepilin-type N-terminal cleavage/methylation domain-containing protein [bacterium]